MDMSNKNRLIRSVSAKLLWPLAISFAAFFLVFVGQRLLHAPQPLLAATPFLVILMGAIGGFVSIQRRLNELPEDKLELMAGSFVYTVLAPFVGGVLSLLCVVFGNNGAHDFRRQFISLEQRESFPTHDPLRIDQHDMGYPSHLDLFFQFGLGVDGDGIDHLRCGHRSNCRLGFV